MRKSNFDNRNSQFAWAILMYTYLHFALVVRLQAALIASWNSSKRDCLLATISKASLVTSFDISSLKNVFGSFQWHLGRFHWGKFDQNANWFAKFSLKSVTQWVTYVSVVGGKFHGSYSQELTSKLSMMSLDASIWSRQRFYRGIFRSFHFWRWFGIF